MSLYFKFDYTYTVYSTPDVNTKDLAVSWGSVTAFDSIVFFLTLYKGLNVRVWVSDTLYSLMIRDGMGS